MRLVEPMHHNELKWVKLPSFESLGAAVPKSNQSQIQAHTWYMNVTVPFQYIVNALMRTTTTRYDLFDKRGASMV